MIDTPSVIWNGMDEVLPMIKNHVAAIKINSIKDIIVFLTKIYAAFFFFLQIVTARFLEARAL